MGLGSRSRSLLEWLVYGAAILLLTANLFNSYKGNGGGGLLNLRNLSPSSFLGYSAGSIANCSSSIKEVDDDELELRVLLEKTATPNKTVILTSLNEAWAAPGSIFDLFLESLRTGNNTQQYLNHLLVVSFDDGAHARCLAVHADHCYRLRVKEQTFNFTNQASFMSRNYLEIVWRKVEFLGNVLTLGYNFVFTDCDIMWLRDPFPNLLSNNANFQVACDSYNGNPLSMKNRPNTGFMYVASDKHTILFYKLWYISRYSFPKMHDQDGFNSIIQPSSNLLQIVGLRIWFLETARFSGFCQLSREFDKVCTVHANCCVGLGRKTHDLRLVLGDWRKYSNNNNNQSVLLRNVSASRGMWSVPNQCGRRHRL